MKQQTAVEQLMSNVLGLTLQLSNNKISQRTCELKMLELFEQAKEMEKQQHRGSFNRGYDRCEWDNSVGSYYDEEPKEFDQYYSETYGK